MNGYRNGMGLLLLATLFGACGEKGNSEETPVLECADGLNDNGNGCQFPCEDGWHRGPDNICIRDCLSMMIEQADGSCALECEDGREPDKSVIVSDTGRMEATYCSRPCPENMVMENGICVIPCGEGWGEDGDGSCYLDCPEGMTPTDDELGCVLASVGENKTCPNEKWDTAISGPNPIFVDPASDPASGDGTEEAPYATIGEAVGAMGDEGTIYLAEGTYDEQVIVDGKKTFNLIGVCAAKVIIAPSVMVATYPEGSEAKPAAAVLSWKVESVRIHGITARSTVESGIKIRHDYDAVDALVAQVDQVVVDQAETAGIGVYGAYREIFADQNTIASGEYGIDMVSNSSDEVIGGETLPVGDVTVTGNAISGLTDIDNRWDVTGIFVMANDTAYIAGNQIAGFENAIGIDVFLVRDLTLEGNIISDVTGYGGVHIIGPYKEGTPCDVTVRDNIISGIFAGSCSYSTCPDTSFGIDMDTTNSPGPFHAVLERNRIRQVQGEAIALYPDNIEGNSLTVSDSFIETSSGGIMWGAGDLNVSGSRFSGNWVAIQGNVDAAALVAGDMILVGNVFENREEDPAGMPEKFRKAFANGVVFITADPERGDMQVSQNLFRNNAAFDMDTYLSVLNLSGDTLSLEGNVFYRNAGAATWVLNGSVISNGNQYIENETGLTILQAAGMLVESADITDNYFLSNQLALDISWLEATGTYTVEENTFVNSAVVVGSVESIGVQAAEINFHGNYFGAAPIQAFSADTLTVSDNLFEECRLVVAGQPEEASATVSENLFERSHLDVFRVSGPVDIENNEFNGPSKLMNFGTGLGVYESPGLVKVIRNVFRDYAVRNVEETGEIGDGIHAAGSAEGDACNLWIASNLLENNGRYGVFLTYAGAQMENNMYVDNGKEDAADLVYFKPVGDGISGGESAFAVEAQTPPPSIAAETILGTLR